MQRRASPGPPRASHASATASQSSGYRPAASASASEAAAEAASPAARAIQSSVVSMGFQAYSESAKPTPARTPRPVRESATRRNPVRRSRRLPGRGDRRAERAYARGVLGGWVHGDTRSPDRRILTMRADGSRRTLEVRQPDTRGQRHRLRHRTTRVGPATLARLALVPPPRRAPSRPRARIDDLVRVLAAALVAAMLATMRRLWGRRRRRGWSARFEVTVSSYRGTWSLMPRIGLVRWRNVGEALSPLRTNGLEPKFVRHEGVPHEIEGATSRACHLS